MEPEILQAFVDEVSAEVPAIRRGLLVYAQNSGSASDLDLPLELVRMILSGASMYDVSDVVSHARDLEASIVEIISGANAGVRSDCSQALDRLANLEESLIRMYYGSGSPAMDVSAFVDESFNLLQLNAEQPRRSDEPAQAGGDDQLIGFEIDDELLEVFALEAEGLLKNIESSLEAMSRDPLDRDALWEIRRNAHTFKGAAGIVGFKKPSELAHRVEDLLDRLAESELGPTVAVFDVLRHATDCLQAMTNGDASPQLAGRVVAVYHEFDSVLEALHVVPAEAPAEAVSLVAARPVNGPVSAVTADLVSSQKQPKRSIVRVSLGRLDELVSITRDLLIGRSVFEQRLKDLELQIDELHNATRRLQTTSGKLEVDFEASMLGSPYGVSSRGSNSYSSHQATKPSGFDELELDHYTDFHQSTRQLSEATSDTLEINNALDSVRDSFETLFDQQRVLIEQIQEKLMRIRMVEFGSLATRLQRVVTVTCEEEDKKVRLTVDNEKLELDTQILDAFTEPLMHLLKNAVVHGIESPDTRRMLGKPENGEIRL
ncbi:MAG TPA: Hpt domain-containing protein, partial [Pyrinomonadaceae bacterium]|nr:Hpt domain-containing protein [Pyrinomonadaceae bacterium]